MTSGNRKPDRSKKEKGTVTKRGLSQGAGEGAFFDVGFTAKGLAPADGDEWLAVGAARLLLILEQSGRDLAAFGLSQHEGSPSLDGRWGHLHTFAVITGWRRSGRGRSPSYRSPRSAVPERPAPVPSPANGHRCGHAADGMQRSIFPLSLKENIQWALPPGPAKR